MASFPNWERQLLRRLGAPVTKENLRFLSAWQRAEGGSARFNPLNTTQHAAGAGSYNSVGVRNYRNAQQGLSATLKTLLNGRYTGIVNGLKNGAPAGQLADELAASPWGTNGKLVHEILGTTPGRPPAHGGGGARMESAIPAGMPPDLHAVALQNLSDIASHGGHFDPMEGLANLTAAVQASHTLQLSNGTPVHVQGKVTKPVKDIVKLAEHYLGVPYVWGGTTPKGFDCSGLLQFLYKQEGIDIPRVTYDQFRAGVAIPKGKLRAGDAVFFKGSDSKNGLPGHVGIYIGGGRFIEAPHSGATVRISKLEGRSDYMGARRY